MRFFGRICFIAPGMVLISLSLQVPWQLPVLAAGVVWLFLVRRGVVSALVLAGLIGVVVTLTGASV